MKLLTSIVLFLLLAAFTIAANLDVNAPDFPTTIASHDLTFVKFYAPWCGHCKRMAPVLDDAAGQLQAHLTKKLPSATPKVAIIKVDCTADANKALCKSHSVKGYPTIMLFPQAGKPYEYGGKRTVDAILGAITSHFKNDHNVIGSTEDLNKFTSFSQGDSVNTKVVIYTRDNTTALFSTAREVATALNGDFLSVGVFPAQQESERIEIFRYGEPSSVTTRIEALADAKKQTIVNYIKKNSLPIFGHAHSGTYNQFKVPKLPIVAVVTNKTTPQAQIDAIGLVAKHYLGKLTFVQVNRDIWSKFPTLYNLQDVGIVIDDSVTKQKFVPPAQDLTDIDAVHMFVDTFLQGTLTPFVRSQPLPESNSGPLVTLVAHNYDAIVHSKEHDVVVLFHAPWCGHCKKARPIYSQLAQKYAGDSHVIIAEIDATANDFVGPKVTGYPSFYIFPRDSKSKPIKHTGPRTVPSFTDFIEKHRNTKAGDSKPADSKPLRDEL